MPQSLIFLELFACKRKIVGDDSTHGVSVVGEILAVTGDSFTSRNGPWPYT